MESIYQGVFGAASVFRLLVPTDVRSNLAMPPKAPPIGHRWFTDGVNRPVFADSDGHQFVLDHDGQPLDGVWLVPEENDLTAPIVVSAR